jgi:nucleotide-binding universal stress UspA family protein
LDTTEILPGAIPANTLALGLATVATERLRNQFPSWKVHAEAIEGSPADEIIKRAHDWQPDLIVIGAHGRSTLGTFLFGSVSHSVINKARSSVRVARTKVVSNLESVRILIGLYGSQAAVREVASRKWPAKTEATIITAESSLMPMAVAPLVPRLTKWLDEGDRSNHEWTHKLLDNAVADLRQAGLIARSAILVGDPKHVLIEEAKKWNADTIFVSSVGFDSWLQRCALGSVSAAVANCAHCTVEVVRAKKRQS